MRIAIFLLLTIYTTAAYADLYGTSNFAHSEVDAEHSAAEGYILYLVSSEGNEILATGAAPPLQFTLPGNPTSAAFLLQSHNAAGSGYTPVYYWQADPPEPIGLVLPPNQAVYLTITFGEP